MKSSKRSFTSAAKLVMIGTKLAPRHTGSPAHHSPHRAHSPSAGVELTGRHSPRRRRSITKEDELVVVRNTEVWRGRQRMRRHRIVDECEIPPGSELSWQEKCHMHCTKAKKPPQQDPYGMVHANWLHALDEGEEESLVDLGQHVYKTGVVQDGGIAPVWLPRHMPDVEIPWEPRLAHFSDVRICKLTLWDSDVGMGADDVIGEGVLMPSMIAKAVDNPNVEQRVLEIALTTVEEEDGNEEEDAGVDDGSAQSISARLAAKDLNAAGTVFISLKFDDGVELGVTPCLVVIFHRAEGLPDKEHTKIANINDLYDPTLIFMWIPVVLTYVLVGVLYYKYVCEFSTLNALYFCWVTFTTVGYGDHGDFGTFYGEDGQARSSVAVFTSMYMLCGVLVMGIAATLYLNLVSKVINKLVHRYNKLRKKLARKKCCEKLLLHNEKIIKKCRKGRTFDCNAELMDVLITAVSVVAILLSAAVYFAYSEELTFGQGFYFACSTATTVGYGDLSPSNKLGKIIALFLLPSGTVLTAKALGDMSGVLFRIQSLKMERKVMKQFGNGIHFQDFADLKKQIGSDPQNSRITKNEFLLAMIMRLGRLRETDQSLILGIYNDLDTDGSGDLDISDCVIGSVPTAVLLKHGILREEDWEADDSALATVAPVASPMRRCSSTGLSNNSSRRNSLVRRTSFTGESLGIASPTSRVQSAESSSSIRFSSLSSANWNADDLGLRDELPRIAAAGERGCAEKKKEGGQGQGQGQGRRYTPKSGPRPPPQPPPLPRSSSSVMTADDCAAKKYLKCHHEAAIVVQTLRRRRIFLANVKGRTEKKGADLIATAMKILQR